MSIDPTLVSTKAQAIEVINYDLPQLLSLKATLRECEREWEKLDDLDEELGDLIDTRAECTRVGKGSGGLTEEVLHAPSP